MLPADAFRIVTVNEPVHLFLLIEGIDGKHGDIHIRILHAGIFPVDQMNIRPFRHLADQKIIRHRIDVTQRPPLRLTVNIRTEPLHPFQSFLVIPVAGRLAVPQLLIEVNPLENIKGVFHRQILLMEFPQKCHALIHLFPVLRVTAMASFQVLRHLIAVLRIKVVDGVADAFSVDGLIDLILLLPVDQLIRSLSGNPHDIVPAPAGKPEGTVGHPFFQHPDIQDFFLPAAQHTGHRFQQLRFQVPGFLVQFFQLFIGIDLKNRRGRHHAGTDPHLFTIHQRLLPEIAGAGFFRAKLLHSGADPGGVLLRQIGDSDHGISAFFRLCLHQFQLPVHPEAALIVHQIRYHIPGIQLPGGKRIILAPDITGNDIGISQTVFHQIQGIQVVFQGIVPVDLQPHAVPVHEIFVGFFHKSHHYRDIPDARFLKLPDLPLDQRLIVNLQQSLGHLLIDGHHPQAETGCQNHRVFRALFADFLLRLAGQMIFFRQISLLLQGSQRLVDLSQRVAGALRQLPLPLIASCCQAIQDIHFYYFHEICFFSFS